MTNYAAVIDRVIIRQTRSGFTSFLATYQLGCANPRNLQPDELALILSVVDDFLVDGSFGQLGMAEFADLYRRLAELIERQDLAGTADGISIRNTCFDALACIKALEARLIGVKRQIDRAHQTAIRQLANDQ